MLHRAHWPPFLLAALILVAGLADTATAQLPNLTWYHHAQMTYPLTPTDTIVAGPPVTLPASLPGNMDSIYLSWGLTNPSATGTTTPFSGSFRLDGAVLDGWSLLGMSGTSWIVESGLGPYNVRGGRHTLGVVIDELDDVTESNENDNVWAHQFVFTPFVLTADTPKWRGTPPPLADGTADIVDGSPIDYNCDGFRFTSTDWWNAVVLYAENDADDYDMELFTPSTGPEDGFTAAVVGSYFGTGGLDALIVNRNTVGVVDYDVGVLKALGGDPFVIEHVTSEPTSLGAAMSVPLGTDDHLRIWDTWIHTTGWATVKVSDPIADGEAIKVGWLDDDTTLMGLSDKTDWVATDADGQAALHRNFTTTGYYGLVVYRDPQGGGAPKTLQVDIEPTQPDLIPSPGHHWHAALVPASTQGDASLPDTLHGFQNATYLNAGVENFSPVSSPAAHVSIYHDGLSFFFASFQTTAMPAYDHWDVKDTNPYEYPGGRHTLTLEVDFLQLVDEIYETNNLWGEQFCWSPQQVNLGTQYSNTYPGPWTGGLENVEPGTPLFYNCDGYRFNAGYSEWEGFVLTQGPGSDYDLSLHYPLEGVKDGFDDYLKTSQWGPGKTDYLLFNNQLMTPAIYDIGVENLSGTYDDYTVEAVGSINMPDPIKGTHGPYTMGISHMLQLYNIYLEADVYAFRLDNLAGTVDWGIGLHPRDMALQERIDLVPGGMAWVNGPGDDEWFTVNIPDAGYYGLAVYKDGPLEFDKAGTYQLRILQGVSGVDDTPAVLPEATALAGVYPNPFNPQTRIVYDLAVGGYVDLAVYDVKGALVRRLVREVRSAGRHQVIWSGEDDAGGRVASGAYVARYIAGGIKDAQKVMVVK
ncbi:MAG: FlgD immunoglobulin-like domain containing protein [Candidatus Krumholzibacteria bacterium]|nr:FlgD immunoglobulin-like domain containing protein [Candidatus Krumholzibacteria bacterium]